MKLDQRQLAHDSAARTCEIPPFIDDTLSPGMLKAIFRLPPQTQFLFVEGYWSRAKSVPKGYGFWLVGLHHAYLGDWFLQFVFWLSCGLVVPGVLWWLADLVRTQGLVRRYNDRIANDVLANIALIEKSAVPA